MPAWKSGGNVIKKESPMADLPALDTRIPLQIKVAEFPDPQRTFLTLAQLKSAQGLQQLREAQLAKEQREAQQQIALKDVFRRLEPDDPALMRELYQTDPEFAAGYAQKQQQTQTQHLLGQKYAVEGQKQGLELLNQITSGVKEAIAKGQDPQAAWTWGRNQAIQLGLPNAAQTPEVYDPELLERYSVMGQDQLKRTELALKQRQLENLDAYRDELLRLRGERQEQQQAHETEQEAHWERQDTRQQGKGGGHSRQYYGELGLLLQSLGWQPGTAPSKEMMEEAWQLRHSMRAGKKRGEPLTEADVLEKLNLSKLAMLASGDPTDPRTKQAQQALAELRTLKETSARRKKGTRRIPEGAKPGEEMHTGDEPFVGTGTAPTTSTPPAPGEPVLPQIKSFKRIQ
jgi:hypothetical protein